jgi:serine/threonine-protein kinase
MLMEWVDGYDLRCLLGKEMLSSMRARVESRRWLHLNDVVIDEGPTRSRLKPGIAIQILRECLIGLAALHRAGLAHGDIKPDNIMLKRTGNVKLVDFGTAVDTRNPGVRIAWTPTYAAPEVLEGAMNSAQSDLASLGYVFLEMLSGCVLFERSASINELLEAKRNLPNQLDSILPVDVLRDKELTGLCRCLIAPEISDRVSSAEQANLDGAVNVHRRLVKTGLDSDYENDIRVWMEALPPHSGERIEAARPAVARGEIEPLWLGDSTILV